MCQVDPVYWRKFDLKRCDIYNFILFLTGQQQNIYYVDDSSKYATNQVALNKPGFTFV